MSFEFGLKNVLRNRKQSLSYIITIGALTSISIFFIYLGNGLGLVFFNRLPKFNITTSELFSQYFKFIIISSIFITIVWIVVINHSIIQHKTHDIAIMKSMGAIQKKMRSHFFAVVLVIDIIGAALGLITGFVLYLFFFFILSAIGYDLVIYIDIIFSSILVSGIFLATFLVNGYELWKVSNKSYANIALGDIPRSSDVQLIDFKPRKRFGLKVKLALRNLTRKRKSFYRVLLTSGLTLSIIVSLTVCVVIISSTSFQSIEGAQGGDTLVIGHSDVVNHYIQRYEEFSDPNLDFSNNENLTKSQYLMNETTVNSIFNGSAHNFTFWDKRLLVYQFAIEMKGYIWNFDEGNASYYEIGENRSGFVPVLGMEFKEYTLNWKILGTLNESSNTAPVGDTLAYSMFESATYQKIRLQNVSNNEYHITGILLDSFCAGNATYIHLDALQQDLYLNDYINLVVVGVSPEIDKTILMQNLQLELNATFGPDFIVRDLTPTFKNNIFSLYPFVIISVVVILIETIIIISSLFLYQLGNFRERAPDYVIIRAMGGTSKLIKSVIFLEDLSILLIASSFAIGVSLIFNSTLLYEDAFLPPLWFVFLLWFSISILVISIVGVSIYFLYKELDKIQKEVLKDFSRAK